MTDRAYGTGEAETGTQIVSIARDWIGTPYRHQASCKGAGTDCLGLLRGVWREYFGTEPEPIPPYTADWSVSSGSEDLLAAAYRNLFCVELPDARAGDVVVMRMRDGGAAKHTGILGGPPGGPLTLIHAYSGQGVVESPLSDCWRRRIAGVFRFPDRIN